MDMGAANIMTHTLPLQAPLLSTLPPVFYEAVRPTALQQPVAVAFNTDLAEALGLATGALDYQPNLLALSGSLKQYPQAPLATVYSGHQFGVYVPQLGDGRAMLLGDSIDAAGRRWEWQLKGAGKTPYSRFADGRAVLRSSIREYLCSEAMHGLGIATTRALALTASNDAVYRETAETAAVVTRIAPSFLRFGHFEYFYHRSRHEYIQPLADFLLRHHYPECAGTEAPYLALFNAIVSRSAELVAGWQSVGFTHGVLNTDNMSLLGLSIDYGPFGFMDGFSQHYVPNHSDDGGRYAYKEQPYIFQWNLSCLASAFLPLVAEADLVRALDDFVPLYWHAYWRRMRAKLGLATEVRDDEMLISDLLAAMHADRVDFTLMFRYLSEIDADDTAALPEKLIALWENRHALASWVARYRQRLRTENRDAAERKAAMDAVNPLYVLRNYLLEQAIVQARDLADYREIDRLQRCMADPFTERAEFADFAVLPPAWADEICLSCSS